MSHQLDFDAAGIYKDSQSSEDSSELQLRLKEAQSRHHMKQMELEAISTEINVLKKLLHSERKAKHVSMKNYEDDVRLASARRPTNMLRETRGVLSSTPVSPPRLSSVGNGEPPAVEEVKAFPRSGTRSSLWGSIPGSLLFAPASTQKRRSLSNKSSSILLVSEQPPQYPKDTPLERLGMMLERSASAPTRLVEVVPRWISEPRASHLLPEVLGRSVEDSMKDERIHFKGKLFKRVRQIDTNRLKRELQQDGVVNSMAFLFESPRFASVH